MEKAEALNKQFFTFFIDEDHHVPTLESNPFPNNEDLYFSTHGISCILKNLQANKTPGPDEIPTYILKLCNEEIVPILQIIFIQSFKDRTLPNDWLTANVVPIFKKGSCNSPSNYRPISLTLACCKVMEHVIFHFIMDHLDKNNIINNHQHGFRPAHSCQSQLILITEDIFKTMDAHKQVDLILLDFCKAFDKVPHQRLLAKLKYYGIQGNLLNWITEWMTKRQQRVVLENKASAC